jgi:hypothetical protein
LTSSGYELRAFDLALQDEDLMAQREDLGIAFVAGHQQHGSTVDKVPEQIGKDQRHGR